MTQIEIDMWDFITQLRYGFRGLESGEFKGRQQHPKFGQALEQVKNASKDFHEEWKSGVITEQKKYVKNIQVNSVLMKKQYLI